MVCTFTISLLRFFILTTGLGPIHMIRDRRTVPSYDKTMFASINNMLLIDQHIHGLYIIVFEIIFKHKSTWVQRESFTGWPPIRENREIREKSGIFLAKIKSGKIREFQNLRENQGKIREFDFDESVKSGKNWRNLSKFYLHGSHDLINVYVLNDVGSFKCLSDFSNAALSLSIL